MRCDVPTELGELALELLEDAPDGTLAWAPRGLPLLRAELHLTLDGAHAERAVEDLLALSTVLRGKRRSPAAAEALLAILRAEPRAEAIARKKLAEPKGIDALRDFAAREGRDLPVRAREFGARGPRGAIPAHLLLDPGRDLRARPLPTTKGANR